MANNKLKNHNPDSKLHGYQKTKKHKAVQHQHKTNNSINQEQVKCAAPVI